DADALLAGDGEEATAGVLLEQVVDDLQRVHAAGAQRLVAVLGAADRGAERQAVGANLSLALEAVELGEQVVAPNGVHAGVVKLVKIDVIRGQAAQALLERFADEGGREVLRQLALARARAAVAVEVVAELGGDDDAVALAAEGLRQDGLAQAVAVGVGGVVEGDPQV